MITSTPDKVEQFVGGKNLLIVFGGSVLAAAVVGTVGYFVFHALLGNTWGTTVSQILTLQVYMVLLIAICVRFRPVTEPPIALRPSAPALEHRHRSQPVHAGCERAETGSARASCWAVVSSVSAKRSGA
jgi:hypothetical protein